MIIGLDKQIREFQGISLSGKAGGDSSAAFKKQTQDYEDALKRTQDAEQIQRLKTKLAAPVANEQHAQH